MATKQSKPYDGPEFLPPKDHPDVPKRIFQVLKEIIDDKITLGLHDKWTRNHELVKNKHWRNKTSAAVPLVSANLLFVHIQRTANTLTDNNPNFNVARIGGEDESQYPKELIEDIQHAADHWWIDQEQQDVLDSSVRNGEEYGLATEKVVFNPELEGGYGEVETIIVDPFHFGVYPVKLTDPRLLQKCEAVFHFFPMSVREAKRRWPDKAKDIKPDAEEWKDLGDDRREIAGTDSKKEKSLMVSISSTVKELFNYLSGSTEGGADVLICECWCKDYTEIKKTKGNVEESEYLYPGNIRYAVATNSGKVLLEDRKNPSVNWNEPLEEISKSYLFDKFPFSAANSIKDTTCFWGMSDIEQLEYLNIELDKAISQMVLYKDKAARLKIINPKDSGVNDEEFDNYPSVIRPTNANSAASIRYLEVPAMPVDIQAAIQLFKDMFFLVAGTFEMDQAQVQGRNVIAYKAIAALLERAATMMRGKTRSYSRLIRERGRMFFSHVQNWYTEERWITYQDRGGMEVTKKIDGRQMRIPAKLTVVTGSTLPISRVQQREEALGLFNAHAIDQPDLLDKIEWPDRNQVIERMKAGPLGEAMNKLSMIGVPGELLQIFTNVAMADPKQLQSQIESGKVPTFAQIFQAMLQDMQGQGQGMPQENPAEAAEAMLKQAEAEKMRAETQLIIEKINTEKVAQQVKIAGTQFDQQQLEMMRAKTVKELETSANEDDARRADTIMNIKKTNADIATSFNANRPGFNEQGMRSDNE